MVNQGTELGLTNDFVIPATENLLSLSCTPVDGRVSNSTVSMNRVKGI